MIEASHELFGDHRVLEASPAVDSPGKERQAAEFILVNLPFKVLRPLMEYSPTSSYLESEAQVQALEYWMRTPYYPADPDQAVQAQVVHEGRKRQKAAQRLPKPKIW